MVLYVTLLVFPPSETGSSPLTSAIKLMLPYKVDIYFPDGAFSDDVIQLMSLIVAGVTSLKLSLMSSSKCVTDLSHYITSNEPGISVDPLLLSGVNSVTPPPFFRLDIMVWYGPSILVSLIRTEAVKAPLSNLQRDRSYYLPRSSCLSCLSPVQCSLMPTPWQLASWGFIVNYLHVVCIHLH